MDDNSFVFGIVLVSILASLVVTWMLVRLAHRITDSRARNSIGLDATEAGRELQLFASENAGLKSHVTLLENRIAVLERIVTDPAERTAREIENLRQN